MKYFLAIWGILSFLGGIGTLAAATSTFHETGGYILFLMSAVCFASSSIIKNLEVISDMVWKKTLNSGKNDLSSNIPKSTDWVKELD
jgi:hypothetical protein